MSLIAELPKSHMMSSTILFIARFQYGRTKAYWRENPIAIGNDVCDIASRIMPTEISSTF